MNICISCPAGHPVMLAAEKLGQVVACPRCFATFPAELALGPSVGARKDDHKVRRARDDDDEEDDEEEEDERPKKKPVAKKEVKKPTKSRARDDDEDEDDEDDEEAEGEPEAEIEWTGRKRQLNTCGIGLMIMMVAFYMLAAMIVFLILPMIWYIFDIGNAINNSNGKLVEPKPGDWVVLGAYIIAPMAALALTPMIVGLFFNFFVPARAEARGMVLCALIFGGLVYLLGVLILMSGSITENEAGAANLNKLMGALAGLCFVICIMSAMAYMSKLMIFMKLHLESSQPITNAMFFFLYFGAMFVIFVANSYICYYLFWFACFGMILALFFTGGMAVRTAIAQALLFVRMRSVIMKFIRDD